MPLSLHRRTSLHHPDITIPSFDLQPVTAHLKLTPHIPPFTPTLPSPKKTPKKGRQGEKGSFWMDTRGWENKRGWSRPNFQEAIIKKDLEMFIGGSTEQGERVVLKVQKKKVES